MGVYKKYYPFFASALLMWVVLGIIYPHCQYYIDPDGTAYLTISRRYANGDIQRAINGYWSPWACWLTAGLMRLGMQAIPASVVVNAAGATGFLFISQSFFLRFSIVRKFQWLLNVTLAFFLCYAIFWQSFDDLWECFFLLAALRLMLAPEFRNRPVLWIGTGLMGALAYFAKAYSFPFFILNTVCCTYCLCRENKALWLKISFVSVGVMILCAMPWIWALRGKYGIWTTSTSGSLNMSWYLVGHPHWKPGIDVLIPPVYPDSPYYWEDPWYANGDTPHFWDSWHLFGLQFLRIGLNIWKFLVSTLQLSVFFPAVVIVAKLSLLHKKVKPLFSGDARILVLSFLLFPLGYLLVNFEPRYLWYMVPLGMVICLYFVQKTLMVKWQFPLAILIAVTFTICPIIGMIRMFDEGKEEHNISLLLRAKGIKGTFMSDALPGIETQRMERLAYFSGDPFYAINRLSEVELQNDKQRNNVKYYIATFYDGHEDDKSHRVPRDKQGNPYPCVLSGGQGSDSLLSRCGWIGVFRLD